MNTLQELNGYISDLELPFTDNRLATVYFDRQTPNNRNQIVNEGSTFTIQTGIEITDIANGTISLPKFRISVANLFGTTVSWDNLPANLTVSNPDVGVYEVTGMLAIEDWQAVRQAKITIPGTAPSGYTGNWTYGCSILYYDEALGNQTKSWTVAVTVLDVLILTNPFDFVFDLEETETLTNTPQITDQAQYAGATWTITATPSSTASISSFSSTYSGGGTFTYNTTTKAFTIVGSRTQVNGHLNNILFTSTSVASDFSLAYSLTNNIDQAIDNKQQFLKNANLLYLTNPEVFYYIEDSAGQIVTGTPRITDTGYVGEDNYTFTITPSNTTYIETITTNGSGGTINFNTTTKVYTITGTKTQVNERLGNLYIKTETDVDQTFSLIYSVVTPGGNNATKIQTLICGSNDTEVTNMNITRTYKGNNQNFIFATSTPSITDFDSDITNVYTVFFSSALGKFELAQSVNPYIPGQLLTTLSITGTRDEINNSFAKVVFYPNTGVTANGSFTYEQQKNGVTQVSQQVALQNDGVTQFTNREVEFLVTQTWTPSYSDVLYGKISKILVVGAGGGGGVLYDNGSLEDGGAGGAGGDVIINDNNYSLEFTPDTTYTITIGIGGKGSYILGSIRPALAGTSTSAFGITANGGSPGTRDGNDRAFGGSGSKSIINGTTFGPFTGGTGDTNFTNSSDVGAGGSGAAQNGQNSPGIVFPPLYPGTGKGGLGVTYNGKDNWYGHGGMGGFYNLNPPNDIIGWQQTVIDGVTVYRAFPNSGIGGSGGGFTTLGFDGGSGYVKIWITGK